MRCCRRRKLRSPGTRHRASPSYRREPVLPTCTWFTSSTAARRPTRAARTRPAAPGSKTGVSLLAALCDGTAMLVRVDGLLKRHDGVEDRRFAKLVVQATRELLAPPPAPRP